MVFLFFVCGEKENVVYWIGYVDVLEDLLKKIECREVRV